MKSKWSLYLGIVLLTLGIILKSNGLISPYALIILLSGVAFKIVYIISKIVSGEYKPGNELILLMLGLTLFLTGVYFKSHPRELHHAFLMAPGIALKLSFIFIFILKIRKPKSATIH